MVVPAWFQINMGNGRCILFWLFLYLFSIYPCCCSTNGYIYISLSLSILFSDVACTWPFNYTHKTTKKPSSHEKPLGVPNHLGLAERKPYGFQSKDFIPSEKSTWGFVSYGLTDLINKDLQRVRTLARQTSGIKQMVISILHIQTNLSFGYKFVHSSQVLIFVSFCFVWTHLKKKTSPHPGNRQAPGSCFARWSIWRHRNFKHRPSTWGRWWKIRYPAPKTTLQGII